MPVSDFMNEKGIGDYKDASGKLVPISSLPKETQAKIKHLGALRDLMREAHGPDHPRTKKYQDQINHLFNPDSRRNPAQEIADEIGDAMKKHSLEDKLFKGPR